MRDNRPTGSRDWRLPDGVDPESMAAVVATNLWRLMNAAPDLNSQMQVARKAGIGQATVDRILDCTPGTRLNNIEKIARAFGIQPYLLLHPNPDMARTEQAFYSKMRGEFQSDTR